MRILLAAVIIAASAPASAQVTDAMIEKLGRDYGRFVRYKGFNCPEGKLVASKGEDEYGSVFQVFCGDKGKPFLESKTKLVFRVTIRPDASLIVAPWVD